MGIYWNDVIFYGVVLDEKQFEIVKDKKGHTIDIKKFGESYILFLIDNYVELGEMIMCGAITNIENIKNLIESVETTYDAKYKMTSEYITLLDKIRNISNIKPENENYLKDILKPFGLISSIQVLHSNTCTHDYPPETYIKIKNITQ